MKVANVEMAEAWNGDDGTHFAEHAARYRRGSGRLTDRLIKAAAFEPGMQVLDIGCGTGDLTIAAATAVEPGGSVLGVDLSEVMLNVAERETETAGLTNVRFQQCDAQVEPLAKGEFDLVVSSFGVMFFNDPVAAFTNIASALRPGGRVCFLVWQEMARNEWLSEIRAALAVGRSLPTPPNGMPGPFGLADDAATRETLIAAGYANVRIEAVDEPMYLGDDVDDAYAFVADLGIVRGLTAGLDDETKAGALRALRDVVASHSSADGVLMGTAAWLITAELPAEQGAQL
ncbi:MAG: hypothetical protein QOJ00_1953 [Actinomycetota bacterium]